MGPGDADYDAARSVYNGMHDRRPAAVVRPLNDADVMAAVRYAAGVELPLALRGGGHSVPGYGTCDAGIVLDLRPIRKVHVDPDRRRARVGGGALLRGLDHVTHPFGLATPAGFFSGTGVGGLALGRGISAYLGRKHGHTCDNLLSADVVTADGGRVTASEDRNPDLYWALRGGGGNFGVVTSFEFRLHPVKNVVGGPIFFELDAVADLLGFYRDHMQDAPRELGGFIAFQKPPLPFIPDERHGETMVLVVTCWCGDPGDAGEALAPIREAGPLVAEHVGAMPYPALQSAFDDLLPHGLLHYWKSDFVIELTDDAIEAHLEHGPRVPNGTSTMHLYPLTGAPQEVAEDATALGFRGAGFSVNIAGIWEDPADTERLVA